MQRISNPSVVRPQVGSPSTFHLVRSLDYLIAGRELETRRIGKKVLIPHGALSRFSQANHFASPKDVGKAA